MRNLNESCPLALHEGIRQSNFCCACLVASSFFNSFGACLNPSLGWTNLAFGCLIKSSLFIVVCCLHRPCQAVSKLKIPKSTSYYPNILLSPQLYKMPYIKATLHILRHTHISWIHLHITTLPLAALPSLGGPVWSRQRQLRPCQLHDGSWVERIPHHLRSPTALDPTGRFTGFTLGKMGKYAEITTPKKLGYGSDHNDSCKMIPVRITSGKVYIWQEHYNLLQVTIYTTSCFRIVSIMLNQIPFSSAQPFSRKKKHFFLENTGQKSDFLEM